MAKSRKAKKPKKTRAKRPKKAKTPATEQPQRADVYTMMLIISFIMLTVGSVLMYLENEKYKWDFKAKEYEKSVSITAPLNTTSVEMTRLV